ncbi:MAG: AraC family transcriptional regulator [Nodosilinea sp.]
MPTSTATSTASSGTPEARFSVAIVRDIVQYVGAQGGDCHRLCQAAHIDQTWLNDPDRQVSGDVLKALWREAVQQTGDSDLGLHVGEAFDLAAIGIVGYVLLNCQTYGQALEKLSQYTRLFSQGVAIHHTVADGWVICDCEIRGDVKNYLLDAPRHPIESTLAALVTATQQLTGHPLKLYSLWFQHPQPESYTEHQRIFQTAVQFARPVNRLVFDSNCLSWPVKSANLNLLAIFEDHAAALLSLQEQTQGYGLKVARALAQGLPEELPTLDAIARSFSLSTRQLQRELQGENTSYQQLLDNTRRELALRHLQNPATSVHDLAFLLGFSEPSAFHRAFKRWTGQTPRAFRLGQMRP